jgi:hypothetical protein
MCVIDQDTEAANVLLGNTSHAVLSQACAHLAVYLVDCAEDPGVLRADLAGALQA